MARPAKRSDFGSIEQRGARYRARYTGPDLAWHNAPVTFTTRGDARAWLDAERKLIERQEWTPPKERAEEAKNPALFGAYIEAWLGTRDLKPKTLSEYHRLNRTVLAPLHGVPLKRLTAARVRQWHADAAPGAPVVRQRAYMLLKAVMSTALADGEVSANPCTIRGASNGARVTDPTPATAEELRVIAANMPEKYRLMVHLAAWCSLRYGELIELRRGDISLGRDGVGVIKVRRSAGEVAGVGMVVGTPKTKHGVRDVHIPPHIVPLVREHLAGSIAGGQNGLLFPAVGGTGHMSKKTHQLRWNKARAAAGREDLRFHDLRHTGAVLAAQAGATIPELMERLGHASPQAAMRYQHLTKGASQALAERMSERVEGAGS